MEYWQEDENATFGEHFELAHKVISLNTERITELSEMPMNEKRKVMAAMIEGDFGNT